MFDNASDGGVFTKTHLWSGDFRFQFVPFEPCRVLWIGTMLRFQVRCNSPCARISDLHHCQAGSNPILWVGDLAVLHTIVLLL